MSHRMSLLPKETILVKFNLDQTPRPFQPPNPRPSPGIMMSSPGLPVAQHLQVLLARHLALADLPLEQHLDVRLDPHLNVHLAGNLDA